MSIQQPFDDDNSYTIPTFEELSSPPPAPVAVAPVAPAPAPAAPVEHPSPFAPRPSNVAASPTPPPVAAPEAQPVAPPTESAAIADETGTRLPSFEELMGMTAPSGPVAAPIAIEPVAEPIIVEPVVAPITVEPVAAPIIVEPDAFPTFEEPSDVFEEFEAPTAPDAPEAPFDAPVAHQATVESPAPLPIAGSRPVLLDSLPTAPEVAAALPPSRRTAPPAGVDPDLFYALQLVVEHGASDLHIIADAAPMMRVNGGLMTVPDALPWAADKVALALLSIMSEAQQLQFADALELDFAFVLSREARFRVNVYQQRGAMGAAFRLVPTEIRQLRALGIPETVSRFAALPRGLVLVTGPTGSGKSTTLAALIDLVNRTRADHVVTIEDPIEYIHDNKRAVVNQREVGSDTHSFSSALRHVLRQDPDVILIGELRDLETISVALTAAETGHLVFATLHTQSAAQTIDRIIDVFPNSQQEQVRSQLAATLQGVVSQTLVRKMRGDGRVVATEILVATPAISNLIREGKSFQIPSAMQAGRELGMHTLDQHLAELVDAGEITRKDAAAKAQDPVTFEQLVRRDAVIGVPAGELLITVTTTREFAYTARATTGKVVRGKLAALSEAAVVSRLRGMGVAPISIREAGVRTGLDREIALPGLSRGVRLKDLAIMNRQMATMIAAGLSLLRTLTVVADQTTNRKLAATLRLVLRDVETGSSFSEGLQKHPLVFPRLMIHLVKAGEVGGFLDRALESIAKNFESDVKLRATIRSAMTYPVTVLVIAFVPSSRC